MIDEIKKSAEEGDMSLWEQIEQITKVQKIKLATERRFRGVNYVRAKPSERFKFVDASFIFSRDYYKWLEQKQFHLRIFDGKLGSDANSYN